MQLKGRDTLETLPAVWKSDTYTERICGHQSEDSLAWGSVEQLVIHRYISESDTHTTVELGKETLSKIQKSWAQFEHEEDRESHEIMKIHIRDLPFKASPMEP